MLSIDNYVIDKISAQDGLQIHNLMIHNTERFKRYFPATLAQNLTIALAKEFVLLKVNEFNKKQEFLFTIKQENTIIGLVYIKEIDWNKKQGEFAYCIDRKVKGKGIMSKTIKKLSSYAFAELGLQVLQIIVHKDNLPSVKVAESCSFNWQETLPSEFAPLNETPLDMELYELVKAY